VANEEHLARLLQGVEAWNQWRAAHRRIRPDLSHAHLASGQDFSGVDLSRVDLSWTHLTDVNLSRANFSRALLYQTHLTWTNLVKANLSRADLALANLVETNLTRANLRGAQLQGARLTDTNLKRANLTGCRVYGVSAWNVNLVGAQQSDLVITRPDEPVITVDNVEVAQFIYLLLHNEKIREVIDTITSKVVLILGRFTPERKAVLDAIREALRGRNLLPIMFDFTEPARQTTLETVSTLAHMARFVIADLTDAKSVLQELHAIVLTNPSVPVQPILLASQEEPGMFDFFRRFPWVLESYRYHSLDEVLASLDNKVITPAEKARERLGPMER
jgi:Pentapeptide repeats (8 copies)